MKVVPILVALLALVAPAAAQQTTQTFNVTTMADCQATFQSLDRDGHGAIWREKRQARPNAVPTTVSDREVIEKQAYLDACRLLITQQRQ